MIKKYINNVIYVLLLTFSLVQSSYAIVTTLSVANVQDFQWQGVSVSYTDDFLDQLKHSRWEYDNHSGQLTMVGTRNAVTEHLSGSISSRSDGTFLLYGAADYKPSIYTSTSSFYQAIFNPTNQTIIILYKSSSLMTTTFQGHTYQNKYGPYQYIASVQVNVK